MSTSPSIIKSDVPSKSQHVLLTFDLVRFADKPAGFFNNWGLPVEHFEHPQHHTEINFLKGNRGEYTLLAILFGMTVCIWEGYGRQHNEDGIRSEIKATNTYSKLWLDNESAKPSTWSN